MQKSVQNAPENSFKKKLEESGNNKREQKAEVGEGEETRAKPRTLKALAEVR